MPLLTRIHVDRHLKALGLSAHEIRTFNTLENAESQQAFLDNAWLPLTSRLPAQDAAYHALSHHLANNGFIQPPISLDFPQLGARMQAEMDKVGVTAADIATAIEHQNARLLGEGNEWTLEDKVRVLRDTAFHRLLMQGPVSSPWLDARDEAMDDLDESTEKLSSVQDAQAAAKEDDNLLMLPSVRAKQFAEHYAGLWIAMKAGEHLIATKQFDAVYESIIPEAAQVADPLKEKIDALLCDVGQAYVNCDEHEELVHRLTSDTDEVATRAIYSLVDMAANNKHHLPILWHLTTMEDHRTTTDERHALEKQQHSIDNKGFFALVSEMDTENKTLRDELVNATQRHRLLEIDAEQQRALNKKLIEQKDHLHTRSIGLMTSIVGGAMLVGGVMGSYVNQQKAKSAALPAPTVIPAKADTARIAPDFRSIQRDGSFKEALKHERAESDTNTATRRPF